MLPSSRTPQHAPQHTLHHTLHHTPQPSPHRTPQPSPHRIPHRSPHRSPHRTHHRTFHRSPHRTLLAAALLAAAPGLLFAHYSMLILSRPSVRPGEEVACTLLFGHPYEHEVEPFAPPASIRVLAPGEAEPRALAAPRAEGEAREHAFRFTPGRRGDHILAVEAAERIDASAGTIVRDHLKAILRVRAEDGWERAVGQPVEILPLTRPYGVRAGWTFQGLVQATGASNEGLKVEAERYSPEPPAEPLPEDPFITRTARTGPGGTFSMTLDEPGWWAICASVRREPAKGADGIERPVIERSILWLWVGEPLDSAR